MKISCILSISFAVLVAGCGSFSDSGSESAKYSFSVDGKTKNLKVSVLDNGELVFWRYVDGTLVRFPVTETVVNNAGKLLWKRGDTSVQIGEIRDNDVNICSDVFKKNCEVVVSVKAPEAGDNNRDSKPVYSATIIDRVMPETKPQASPLLYNDLLKYIIPAPIQGDSGSCLYMASTGVMEILLNKAKNITNASPDSETDLSERYLMNYSTTSSITDTVLSFNSIAAVHSTVYPFAVSNTLSPKENWKIDKTKSDAVAKDRFSVPFIERTMVFNDRSLLGGRWEVGIMNEDNISAIKKAMREEASPVQVIYNHFGYWHSVVLVGYDDNKDTSCAWVTQFINQMQNNAPAISEKVRAAMLKGGCRKKGVFFVRDSLTKDINSLDTYRTYGYSTGPSALRYDERSQDWLKYLGNHAYVVSLKKF